jgi:hypothetical protein
MKIIKEGQLPVATTALYRGTCELCRCQVEASDSDLVTGTGRIVNDYRVGAVECPTNDCGKWITVTEVRMR